jgi:hypothetical protein
MGKVLLIALLASVVVGCSSRKVEPEKPVVVMMAERDVPESVMKSFARSYPRASIHRVHKEVYIDGTVTYAFQFRSFQGSDRQVYLNAAGSPIGQ